jgi:nucleoside-diphosphate-sugar epimerase
VIGAGEFLGRHVSRTLAAEVPVIELGADVDEDTMADAIGGVDVIVNCAQTWSPARRLQFRKTPPPLLERLVSVAERAKVRRIVHVSTADVYGSDHFSRFNEQSAIRPSHAYQRLKLFEEEWLLRSADDVEVVILRPGRVFGEGEDWILSRMVASIVRGRLWLPGGGRAQQTFVSASDVGRACLAAADRGRPGHRYLVGGFDSTWRDLFTSAARAVGFSAEINTIPYDVSYLQAFGAETMKAPGAEVWPGVYGVDVLGKPHYFDDSQSRRQLTWSPSVGSFEQEMPSMAPWLSRLPEVVAAVAADAKKEGSTSPRR